MTEPRIEGVPPHFWSAAAAAERRLLMLDYDGTLAPFRIERDQAMPPPAVLARVRSITESPRTRVAIVSGRRLDELERLIGSLPNVVLIGEHGWEEQSPGSERVRYPLPDGARALLESAAAAAAAEGLADRLELKRASIVLHTRGFSPDEAVRMEETCARLWVESTEGARLEKVDGGIELRVRGHHKGTAVRGLIARSEPGALPVYLGDDVTDEDAFEAVLEGGIGIRVGADSRPTLARGHIATTEGVAEFLDTWLDLVEGGRSPGSPGT